MRCSPRWRTSRTRLSSSGTPQRMQRPRPSSSSSSPRIVPASQCAPWITQGTTCSSRQNTARRSASGSHARQPSSGSTGSPHQLQGSMAIPVERVNGRPAVSSAAVAEPLAITILEGDQTGQELLEQAVRVLDPELLGLELRLERFDLSLASRRATDNGVVHEAARAMRESGLGVKAATITPEGADDVGSPNRILREEVDGKVIIRTGRRIPGVTPVAGVHYPISVVRMAVGDAYGAKQWREQDENGDEIAYRTERISREICRAVAEHSFRTAKKIHGRVYGGPKWTVSPVYEGMLKEELDEAAERYPEVPYQPVLIDATYAGLVGGAAD